MKNGRISKIVHGGNDRLDFEKFLFLYLYQLGAHCEHVDTVLYKAYLTTTRNTTSIYIGMTASEIKTIFNNQIKSFNHEAYKNETELSSHVWDLKRRKQNFSIVWSIISQHNNRLTSHNKCSLKKLATMKADKSILLNRRSALVSTWRHREKPPDRRNTR